MNLAGVPDSLERILLAAAAHRTDIEKSVRNTDELRGGRPLAIEAEQRLERARALAIQLGHDIDYWTSILIRGRSLAAAVRGEADE